MTDGRFAPDVLSSLNALHDDVNDLLRQARQLESEVAQRLSPTSVSIELDSAGYVADLRLHEGWTKLRDGAELGRQLRHAMALAGANHAESAAHPPANPGDLAESPPSISIRSMLDLLDEAIKDADQQMDTAAEPAPAGVGHGPANRLAITMVAGTITLVDIDPDWIARADERQLRAELLGALRDASQRSGPSAHRRAAANELQGLLADPAQFLDRLRRGAHPR